jgi:hypothetical protein
VADSAEFTAVRGTGAMPLMFGVASVVEIVVVHLLVPWLWLDTVLGALSVVSIVLLVSAAAVGRVHPHVLTPEALVLRSSGEVVATVERSAIVSARLHRRFGVVAPTVRDDRAVLPNQDGTNVDITLSTRTTFVVPALLRRWRVEGTATSIGLYVDDPAALVAALSSVPADRGMRRTDLRRDR